MPKRRKMKETCSNTTGLPLILRNASRALRRILGYMTQQPEAWVFDGDVLATRA
jgi:hypothetical protein